MDKLFEVPELFTLSGRKLTPEETLDSLLTRDRGGNSCSSGSGNGNTCSSGAGN